MGEISVDFDFGHRKSCDFIGPDEHADRCLQWDNSSPMSYHQYVKIALVELYKIHFPYLHSKVIYFCYIELICSDPKLLLVIILALSI